MEMPDDACRDSGKANASQRCQVLRPLRGAEFGWQSGGLAQTTCRIRPTGLAAGEESGGADTLSSWPAPKGMWPSG